MNQKLPMIGYMERGSGAMTELQTERFLMKKNLELKVQNGIVKKCERHGILYNPREAKECPFCIAQPIKMLAPEKRIRSKIFTGNCKRCSARTIYGEVCSKYECRKAEGLDGNGNPRPVLFLCRFCRCKTKEVDRICTKYQCRKKGGKINMYQR